MQEKIRNFCIIAHTLVPNKPEIAWPQFQRIVGTGQVDHSLWIK